MNCCIDTNIAVDLLGGNAATAEKFSELGKTHNIYITCITAAELYKGAFLSQKSGENTGLVTAFIENSNVLWMDMEACMEFGRLFASLAKSGRFAEEFDLMIASMAKTKGIKIITKNKKHFEHLGAEIEIW